MRHTASTRWVFVACRHGARSQLERLAAAHRTMRADISECGAAEHDRTPLGLVDDAFAGVELIERKIWGEIKPTAEAAVKIVCTHDVRKGAILAQCWHRHR